MGSTDFTLSYCPQSLTCYPPRRRQLSKLLNLGGRWSKEQRHEHQNLVMTLRSYHWARVVLYLPNIEMVSNILFQMGYKLLIFPTSPKCRPRLFAFPTMGTYCWIVEKGLGANSRGFMGMIHHAPLVSGRFSETSSAFSSVICMEIIISAWQKYWLCESWYVLPLRYHMAHIDIRLPKLDPPPTKPVYVIGLRFHILYLSELSDLEDLGLGSRTGVVPILSDYIGFDHVHQYGPRSKEDGQYWMEISRFEFYCSSTREYRLITFVLRAIVC